MTTKTKTLLFTLLFGAALMTCAQEPGDMRGVGRLNAVEAMEQGRNLLFVIGIDKYQNWFQLKNAVSDARGIQEVLMEKFGFAPILDPLYDQNATRDNIKDNLDELRKQLQSDDNLVIFFAGHGETRVDTVGDRVARAGFIIPADGDALSQQRWSSYISIQEFMSEVSRLPARHVTLILDACHSGIALDDSAEQFRGNSSAPPPALVNMTSRRVITSARGNQLASDKGPIGDHSLFTGMLIQGLKTGKADLDDDGNITSAEIGLYLQQSVSSYSGNLQTPDFGVFQLDQRGDMILQLEANTVAILGTNAINQWQAGKMEEFVETFEKLRQLDTSFLDYQILQYYYGMAKKDIGLALYSLDEWERIAGDEVGKLGKRAQGLAVRSAKTSLIYWRKYFEKVFPPADSLIEVNIFAKGELKQPSSNENYLSRYDMMPGSVISASIKNNASVPVFIYALFLDELGRIRLISLWSDPELVYGRGLAPGEIRETNSFLPALSSGFTAIHLIVSYEPVPAFTVPPSDILVDSQAPGYDGELNVKRFWLVFN